jgi:hypothetical protein
MVIFYKYMYTQILFVKVPGAPCCSSAPLVSWALLIILDELGLGLWLLLPDSRVMNEDTYISPPDPG